MKQFIFCTHDFKIKTAVMTDATIRHFDCVTPQKTTIEIPLNYAVANNDIVIIRDHASRETEYIGIVDTVAHEEITSILLFPFQNIFDNECTLSQLDGDVYSWVTGAISANFVNTGDPLNDFPITFENALVTAVNYKMIVESKNLLDNLNELFLNTGIYLRFRISYTAAGEPSGIVATLCNANEEDRIDIRFDNPVIVDSKVLIENSHTGHFNKAIIHIIDSEGELAGTNAIYLRKDNELTTNPEDSERIQQVKPKIIEYTPSADEVTVAQQGEAIILLAQKALCGNAFDHSIEFTVVLNGAYDWRINKRCDFIAEDRVYNTYVTSVEYLGDRQAKIKLGAYRYALTDRFKALRKKEVAADSVKGLSVSDYFENAMYWFTINDDGDLILNYPPEIARPAFSINEDGELILTVGEDAEEYSERYGIDTEGDLRYNVL